MLYTLKYSSWRIEKVLITKSGVWCRDHKNARYFSKSCYLEALLSISQCSIHSLFSGRWPSMSRFANFEISSRRHSTQRYFLTRWCSLLNIACTVLSRECHPLNCRYLLINAFFKFNALASRWLALKEFIESSLNKFVNQNRLLHVPPLEL